MSIVRYSSGLFVAATALFLFSTSAFAQTPSAPQPVPASATKVSTENFPPEIQALLKKGPENLTKEELKRVTDYITTTIPSPSGAVGSSTPPGTVNCFDYYHFGSVQVDLSATLPQTVPGVDMTFSGEVRNTNSYPIVDGQVYVKIFRQLPGETFNQENGSALIDQFPLKETFTLPAHGRKKATFKWHVPENAPGGEYMVAFFFETAKRYNLLGLSFTDDVTGNQTRFTVTTKGKGVATLDKNTVTLNSQLHRFASFPPHFGKDDPVTISAKLVNPRNETITVPVTWKLYAWDSLREESLRNTKKESVELKPRETRTISYVAVPIGSSVSYVVAEARDAMSTSLLDIRFVRDGIDETRINFPGITGYPLEAGKENTLFSCVHSTDTPVVSDNTLTLTLKDDKENVIHTYTYAGDITSAMMGVKDAFTPAKTYATFSLTATLKHKGDIIEEVREIYNCASINPALCPETPVSPFTDLISYPPLIMGIIALLILLLAFVAWRVAKSRNNHIDPAPLVFFILIASILFFGAPRMAEAKSVSISQYFPGGIIPFGGAGGDAIGNISTTITRSLVVLLNGINLSGGETIPQGRTFRVEWPLSDYDIYWVGTGGAFDSPYGRWSSTPKTCTSFSVCPTVQYNRYDYGSGFIMDHYWTGDLAVAPTTPTFSVTNAVCGAVAYDAIIPAYYADCTASAAISSTITVNATWPATTETFSGGRYYKYTFAPTTWYGGPAIMPVTYDVPSATLSSPFTFTIGPPVNQAPVLDTFSSVGSGYTNEPVTINIKATDPEGNTVRYGIDWNMDTAIDEWIPTSGYFPSGVPQTFTHTWNTLGTYTFQAYAQDNIGALSAPLSTTVNIIIPMALSFTATPTAVYSGNPSLLKWDAPTADSCQSEPVAPDFVLWGSGPPLARTNTTGVSVDPGLPSTTYGIRCTRFGPPFEERIKTVTVAVSDTPLATLTASPTTVLTGGQSTLTWSSSGTTHCTGGGFSTGSGSPPSGSKVVSPSAPSTTYSLFCDNGAPQQDVTVTVDENPHVTLTATPTSILTGGSSKLTWTSTNATSCTGDGFSTGAPGPLQLNNPTTGVTINNITTTTIYSITCRKTGYPDAVSTATVNVFPSATVTLTATPSSIALGDTAKLTWDSIGMTSCTSPDFATGGATTNATGVSVSPSYTKPYMIDCTKTTGGHEFGNTVVNVGPAVTFWADPDTINNGDSTHLKWDAPTADSCNSPGFNTGGAKSNNSTGVAVSPTDTATYQIDCFNGAGMTTKFVTVNVNSVAAVLSITATPNRVRKGGGTSTITWSSNVNGCLVVGPPNLASSSKTGSQVVTVTQKSTYTITCGLATKSVTVNVVPGIVEF